jgi:hypothetical protein
VGLVVLEQQDKALMVEQVLPQELTTLVVVVVVVLVQTELILLALSQETVELVFPLTLLAAQ